MWYMVRNISMCIFQWKKYESIGVLHKYLYPFYNNISNVQTYKLILGILYVEATKVLTFLQWGRPSMKTNL